MTDGRAEPLRAEALAFGFPDRPDFLQPVRFDMAPGTCWGIIGPNGAGKSTLLRLLAGLLRPAAGDVFLGSRPLRDLSPRERARRLALLPQQIAHDGPAAVEDVVLLGRHPHRRFGLFENARDRSVAERAMAATATRDLAHRPLSTLSGGEARRVHIAAALAQEPDILLLDEPTAALDLHHALVVFEILRRLAHEDRRLVVVVTHDLNLAARFCDRLLLLDDGACVAVGPSAEVVRPEVLQPIYGVRLVRAEVRGAGGAWILPAGPLVEAAPRGDGRASPPGAEEPPCAG